MSVDDHFVYIYLKSIVHSDEIVKIWTLILFFSTIASLLFRCCCRSNYRIILKFCVFPSCWFLQVRRSLTSRLARGSAHFFSPLQRRNSYDTLQLFSEMLIIMSFSISTTDPDILIPNGKFEIKHRYIVRTCGIVFVHQLKSKFETPLNMKNKSEKSEYCCECWMLIVSGLFIWQMVFEMSSTDHKLSLCQYDFQTITYSFSRVFIQFFPLLNKWDCQQMPHASILNS